MRRNQRGFRKSKYLDRLRFDKKWIRFLSFGVLTLLVLLVCVVVFYHFQVSNQYKQFLETVEKSLEESTSASASDADLLAKQEQKQDGDITFTLTAIGDIMCHNTQYMDAYVEQTDDYDFSYVFEDVYRYIKNSDIAIGSLETSFAGKERGFSNYPTFNSPDQLAFSLKMMGLDVVSTAGNHCLDMGFDGLCRTIDVLDENDISHLGTYKTQEDRDKILFRFVKGVKIAFINYTYGTNGIAVPNDMPFCVNLIDRDLIKCDIDRAKEQGADMIVACMHWGTEYQTTANKEQVDLADFLFANGVDIILGNHPHVLEPMEKRTVVLEDGSQKTGFVVYALGNFICDQLAENTRNSVILNLKVTKSVNGDIHVEHADYVPIYMNKQSGSGVRRMKLLDIEKVIAAYDLAVLNGVQPAISEEFYGFLRIQLEKIISILGPEF